MADRSVIFRFLSDTTSLKRGFAEVGHGAQESEGVFARLEGKLSGVGASGVAAAAGVAGVATSVVAFATEAVKRLGEEQVAAAQTAAAIMSTGDASNVTAAHVHTLAESLGKLSGVDHEVIQSGENLLLTFTSIKNGVGAGNDVFDQATKAALNMSVALGEDMTAASMQLGKALNDPIGGMIALHRVGVQFTDDQKKAIAAFVASGDTMSAQKVILAELNKEFGGSAEAYGKTLPGAIGKAKTAIADWSASVAQDALPAIETFVSKVVEIGKVVGPTLVAALSKVGDVIVSVGRFAKEHAGFIYGYAAAWAALNVAAAGVLAWRTAVAVFGVIASKVDLVITSVRVLALEMGTLNLAMSTLGIGVIIAGFGALATNIMNTKRHTDELKASLSAGLDLKTGEGLAAEAKRISDDIAANQAQYEAFGGTAKRVLGAIGEGFNPKAPDAIAENVSAYKMLQAQQALVLASLKQYNENVDTSSQQLGINTDQVKALAAANGIDLTGATADVTAKLHDVYAAQVAATKGWVGYGVSVEDAVQLQKDVTAAFEAAADPIKVYATALTAVNDAAKTSGKAQADSIRGQAQAARDALTARHDAETAALAGEFITGKASQTAHDQRVKALESQQTAENKAADATVTSEGKRADAIENTAAKTTLTMAQYQASVDANTKAVTTWMTNLALIGARPGGAALEGQLAQLGPTQASLVAEVAKSSGHAFDSFAAIMAKAGKAGADETVLELNKLPGEVQTIAQTSGQTFADTLIHEVATGIVPLSALVATATQDAIAAGVAAAKGTPPGPHDPTRGPSGPAGTESTPSGDIVTQPFVGPLLPGDPRLAKRAEGHFAQVAPAGSWRVWAEPETGGEAYIPLAMSKRAGSMALVTQVAGHFGQRVVPMAAGGTWGVAVGSGGPGGGSGQLGTAVAALQDAVGALQATATRRQNVTVNNTFNEKVDPLHVARKIAWSLHS